MSDIGPGDVVVCVNAQPDHADPLANILTEGRHYRVAVVGIREDGEIACAFRALKCPHNRRRGYAFTRWRFRKIRPADPAFIERIKHVKVDA